MAAPTRPCPGCGTPVVPEIKFCGQCGRDVRDLTKADKRTVMGMPMVTAADVGVGEPPTTPDKPSALAAETAEPATVPDRAPVQAVGEPKTTPDKPATLRRENRTMLGMTAPVAPPPDEAPPEEPATTPAKPVPAAATNRTMLGMPKPDVEVPGEASQKHPEQAVPAATNRTMLGMSARRISSNPPPAMPVHGQRERAAVRYPHDVSADSGTYAPPTRGPSMRTLVVVLGALVLLAALGGVVAYFLFGRGGAEVRASVVQGEEGEALRVEVPGAAEGTKVRFSGNERALEGGAATFPLSADALHLGDNELVVDVVAPNGDVDQSNLTLEVRYRVRADLAGLSEEPPSIGVVVDALPGSEATLDGEALALDGDGHGEESLPLGAPPEGDAAAFDRQVRYRVKLPGEATPEEGVVRVHVPYAQMQLDRPGTDVLTESEAIEIAGAVHAQAHVTVDGQPVEVQSGRFVHRYPLPEPGEYTPRIVTTQPGRAPRVTTIRIRRVEDLAREAAGFEPDPDMSYPRIAQNPSIYRGQKIALEGRVYNVNVEGGRSDVQILVRDCPRGQRCPLWVTYPAATEATVDDWVRVLGTVGGEQQFRSETNRVISVPRVDAQFVLPLER